MARNVTPPSLQAAEYPPNSFERLIHVACFAVSGYASTAKRASKPFNPLLGETYEFVCPEKGFRFISEKVRLSFLQTLCTANTQRDSFQGQGNCQHLFQHAITIVIAAAKSPVPHMLSLLFLLSCAFIACMMAWALAAHEIR